MTEKNKIDKVKSDNLQNSNPANIYGDNANYFYLPFFRKVILPKSKLTEVPTIPTLLMESCSFKIIQGAVIGYGVGIGWGMFMGAMGDVSPIQIIQGREVPQAPLREQVRAGFKGTASKAKGWGKSFCILSALFGGIECLIEKYRAKHDVWNPVISGCVVGGK